jgi:hypothetical protein
MANGQASEVGTIGNEGVVGLPLVLGDDRAPTSVYIQVPGAGLRMKATLFKKELARSASMRTVMLHYAHAFFNQVAQSAACNQFHSIQQRCCRWLLMTHDRMHSDEFLLTQEFLAMMLGVQRTGVTAAAGALQRAGLIRYKRGNVTIDRSPRADPPLVRVLRRFQEGVRSSARRQKFERRMLYARCGCAVRLECNDAPSAAKTSFLIRWSIQEIRRIVIKLAQRRIQPAHIIAWSLWRRAHQAEARRAHLKTKMQL